MVQAKALSAMLDGMSLTDLLLPQWRSGRKENPNPKSNYCVNIEWHIKHIYNLSVYASKWHKGDPSEVL
jgi:hypothetical protein